MNYHVTVNNIDILRGMYHEELDYQFDLRDKVKSIGYGYNSKIRREMDRLQMLIENSCCRAAGLDELISYHS